jgi:RNA polymerase sigma-70 factor (ECF subfamily)
MKKVAFSSTLDVYDFCTEKVQKILKASRDKALLEEEERIQKMRDIVDKLKPRYRRLVEMRYFDEMAYEEIAEELDLPLGTVKAQLFRAREFLFQMMQSTKDIY